MSMLVLMDRLVMDGAQFIIATHWASPDLADREDRIIMD